MIATTVSDEDPINTKYADNQDKTSRKGRKRKPVGSDYEVEVRSAEKRQERHKKKEDCNLSESSEEDDTLKSIPIIKNIQDLSTRVIKVVEKGKNYGKL